MISKTFGDLGEGDLIYIIWSNGEKEVKEYSKTVVNGGIPVVEKGQVRIMRLERDKPYMEHSGNFYIADETFLDFYEVFWGPRSR